MIICEQIGFYAQLVDSGRRNASHFGYTEGGSLDWQSYQFANALVGNFVFPVPQDETRNFISIELTMGDCSFRFKQSCIIAISGANAICKINQTSCDIHKTLWIEQGSELSISQIGHDNKGYGTRVYLAIRGGISAPRVYGSGSSVQRESSGGLHGNGQSLRAGDSIALQNSNLNPNEVKVLQKTKGKIEKSLWSRLRSHLQHFKHEHTQSLRLLPSYQWNSFAPQEQARLLNEGYQVTHQSNRMAVKLEGQAVLSSLQSLRSQGLSYGSVQCTGEGQLIVMLKDRQTIGGYPVIGCLSACSSARLSQCKPEASVRFELCATVEAVAEYRVWLVLMENISKWVDLNLTS